MRTVKKDGKMPRLLVRIAGADRYENQLEKKITTVDGREFTLYLAPFSEAASLRKEELAVQVGEIIGLGEGTDGYQLGDMVLMDYNVDSDEQYLVTREGKDKIVSVPCKTLYHDTPFVHTSYGFQPGPDKFIYTGERNMLIWDAGDVNELSLVYGIVRKVDGEDVLIPNDYWVFCEHIPEKSNKMELANGIVAYRINDESYVSRKVLFCSPNEPGFKEGDQIMAVPQAAIPLKVQAYMFDVIARIDIFAVEEVEAVGH